MIYCRTITAALQSPRPSLHRSMPSLSLSCETGTKLFFYFFIVFVFLFVAGMERCNVNQSLTFSSMVLDAVCRSIDEIDGRAPERFYDGILVAPKKQHISVADRWPAENFQAPPPLVAASSPAPAYHHQDKKKRASIRSKFRDLRKSKALAWPGARLASFLNTLCTCTAAGSSKKSKSTAAAVAATGGGCGRGGEESHPRSCLRKTPSSKGRTATEARSVRFYPVCVVVDEDCRPCGQKCLNDVAPPVPKKTLEELFREFREEEEEDDEWSDSCSDLFELENLTVIGGRASGV